MRLQIRQLAIFGLISSCYSTPEDITACVGSDVNIPWEYPDSAEMSTVSWQHIDTLNVATTILLQAAGSFATVIGGYNIQHNTNGDVTITAATVANSGTYRITVLYSSGTPTFIDDVIVNVYDPPTDFNFTESPSGLQTTFTCTAGSLGDPAAELYIEVNGVDQKSSVSATVSETDIVQCILVGLSVQCISGGSVTSLCAQCTVAGAAAVAGAAEIYNCLGLGRSTAVDREAECACAWFGIGCAIIVCMIIVGMVLGCILVCVKCWRCKSIPYRVRLNDMAVLPFNIKAFLNPKNKITYNIQLNDGAPVALVRYENGVFTPAQVKPGYSVTADPDGIVELTIQNVEEDKTGTYSISGGGSQKIYASLHIQAPCCCDCFCSGKSCKDSCRVCFYNGNSCEDCVNYNYCKCKCCVRTPCGALCNIKGLPYWYQVLWASIVGSPVAFGIWLVWRCNNGIGDRAGSAKYVVNHPEEKKKQGGIQPPPPSKAREGSGSGVSGQDVELQETETSLKRSQ